MSIPPDIREQIERGFAKVRDEWSQRWCSEGGMNNDERDDLRKLQDRWLGLAVVKHQIRNFGEDSPIAGSESPTFREVRMTLLSDWRQWFADFFPSIR